MNVNKMMKTGVAAALLAVAVAGCSGEQSKSASPVALIVSNTQNLQQIDLAPSAANCNQDVGTILMQAVLKNIKVISDQRFNDVRVTSYRVSYVRTDGGTQVPAPFVRTIDSLLTTGGAATSLTKFLIIQGDALSQAPFVALRTENGGRDPETGRPVVKLDVIVELFGETLAGERVSGSTRFPLDFCFACGGCA
ncbi:MAG: hypothetical protein JWO56_3374 [Acidobacteria bacterium]|nr:hypothetical protein [Acidobacteriota bacterium]